MIFQRIEAIVARASGHDVSTLGSKQVERAALGRMTELGLIDPADYECLLNESPAELAELIERVVVNESWFFRDIKPFEYLVKLFDQSFARRGAADPVRILSVPCSAGEEAYSIAIALSDGAIEPARYRIEAADISDRMIERARRGLYRANAFRSTSPESHRRWILDRGDQFEVARSIRDSVRFFRANLLEIDPATIAQKYDVVFCRNLLIYLDTDARRRAGSILDGLIAPGGYLFLGHADPIATLGERFSPVEASGVFAFRDRSANEASLQKHSILSIKSYDHAAAFERIFPPKSAQANADSSLPAAIKGFDAKLDESKRSELSVTESSPISGRSIETSAAEVESNRSLLERATEAADRGSIDLALSLCERDLARSGPTAEAYFLMGVLHQALGDFLRAETDLGRAVYLDPDHEEALLALAGLARRRGDSAQSLAYARRARRAADRRNNT